MSDKDATARRAELEEAVADAERHRQEVRHQAQDAAMRVRELRDQLAARASDHPDEFGEDGAAKAKTEAAKLHRDLQAAENPPVPWERRQQDAADKVAGARRAVDRFTAEHIVALVKAREPDDIANNQRIIDAATAFIEAVRAKNRFAQEIAKLLVPAQGLDPINEVKNTDHLGHISVELKRVVGEGIASSLPVSICTPEGELPPRVPTATGWVSRAHAEVTEEQRRRKQEEQEQREAKAHRNVDIRPAQPEPDPRVLADLYRRGGR